MPPHRASVFFHAHIAVVNHQQIVLCFIHQAAKIVRLRTDAQLFHTYDQSNIRFRKFLLQSLNLRNYRIVSVTHSDYDLIRRIVQSAHARKILIAFTIEALHGFQNTDWGHKAGSRMR